MTTDDPAVQRRRLRVELKKARLDADRTQRDVSDAMDWSVSKLIRIENGDVRISRNDLLALLDYYQVTDQRTINMLLDAAKAAREESWADFRDVHSPAFLTYLGFESSAWQIRNYQPIAVPGHLQTEEYMMAWQTSVGGVSKDVAERRWDGRLRRLRLHERDTPPRMSFITDEAVIHRQVGGPGVMRQQLKRLREWSDEPHISLQIVPFSAGGHPGIGFPFVLLEFQDPNEADVLHLEHAVEHTTRDDPDEAIPYLTRFVELEKIALSAEESKALIDQVITDMEGAKAPPPEEEVPDTAGKSAKEQKGLRGRLRDER